MTTRSTIDRLATYRKNPAEMWSKGEWKAWHYEAMVKLQEQAKQERAAKQ